MKRIAIIHTDFPTKFGIPRQSGLVEELKGQIVFEKEYRNREAVRGLEEFSHIWLLWEFSEAKREEWLPTVRPPKLGGNERVGVFATRSPFRPNPIGLSCVRLDKIEFTQSKGPVLHVAGVDLMDKTPIYDIKPYLPYADAIPDATCGFTSRTEVCVERVEVSDELLSKIPQEKREALKKLLLNDPRPGYQRSDDRVYGFQFGKWEVKFVVCGDVLKVVEILRV